MISTNPSCVCASVCLAIGRPSFLQWSKTKSWQHITSNKGKRTENLRRPLLFSVKQPVHVEFNFPFFTRQRDVYFCPFAMGTSLVRQGYLWKSYMCHILGEKGWLRWSRHGGRQTALSEALTALEGMLTTHCRVWYPRVYEHKQHCFPLFGASRRKTTCLPFWLLTSFQTFRHPGSGFFLPPDNKELKPIPLRQVASCLYLLVLASTRNKTQNHSWEKQKFLPQTPLDCRVGMRSLELGLDGPDPKIKISSRVGRGQTSSYEWTMFWAVCLLRVWYWSIFRVRVPRPLGPLKTGCTLQKAPRKLCVFCCQCECSHSLQATSQRQMICRQICVQICFCVLSELGLRAQCLCPGPARRHLE